MPLLSRKVFSFIFSFLLWECCSLFAHQERDGVFEESGESLCDGKVDGVILEEQMEEEEEPSLWRLFAVRIKSGWEQALWYSFSLQIIYNSFFYAVVHCLNKKCNGCSSDEKVKMMKNVARFIFQRTGGISSKDFFLAMCTDMLAIFIQTIWLAIIGYSVSFLRNFVRYALSEDGQLIAGFITQYVLVIIFGFSIYFPLNSWTHLALLTLIVLLLGLLFFFNDRIEKKEWSLFGFYFSLLKLTYVFMMLQVIFLLFFKLVDNPQAMRMKTFSRFASLRDFGMSYASILFVHELLPFVIDLSFYDNIQNLYGVIWIRKGLAFLTSLSMPSLIADRTWYASTKSIFVKSALVLGRNTLYKILPNEFLNAILIFLWSKVIGEEYAPAISTDRYEEIKTFIALSLEFSNHFLEDRD